MDRAWFESLQGSEQSPRPCQHRIGRSKTRCDCTKYQPPSTIFKSKQKDRKEKQCVNCNHAHVDVSCYEDLNNRSLLLILVEKGRLGDTFPDTFHCLDMRARNRSKKASMMMSTLIQELGRLCRYCKDSDERPYALVSPQLWNDLCAATSVQEGVGPDRLVSLLRSHKERIDSHMRLLDDKSGQTWEDSKGACGTVRELLQLMRKCHKAREKRDEEVPDEDKVANGSKIISYDAGRRNQTLSNDERYHKRRLLLLAEPQLGKTGAVLALIEVHLP